MITERIKSEHRKHKGIEWERIAAYKIYASLNKLFNLQDISNQRDLLIDFAKWEIKDPYYQKEVELVVDAYIKENESIKK